ncbi:hypothetical protein VPH35_032037 [Triticum aestivum]
MNPILRCPLPSIPSTHAAAVRGGDDDAAASARQGGLNPAAAELRETPDGVPWKAWIKEEHSLSCSRGPAAISWPRHSGAVAGGRGVPCGCNGHGSRHTRRWSRMGLRWSVTTWWR